MRSPRAAGPGGDAGSGSAAARGRARAASGGHDPAPHRCAARRWSLRPAPLVTADGARRSLPAGSGARGEAEDRREGEAEAEAGRAAGRGEARRGPRAPHDRARVPLAAFVPAVDELDRGLLAIAGIALLLVALGGAVLLGVARRQLTRSQGSACGCLRALLANAAARPSDSPSWYGRPNGWFTSNVTVRWEFSEQPNDTTGCPSAELITAEGANTRHCTCPVLLGHGRESTVVSIKIDKTAPAGVGGSLARGPDSDGWYNHPVAASFGGQDAVSGIAGCSAPTYAGADSALGGALGHVHRHAGNTSTAASVGFKYDATPPR